MRLCQGATSCLPLRGVNQTGPCLSVDGRTILAAMAGTIHLILCTVNRHFPRWAVEAKMLRFGRTSVNWACPWQRTPAEKGALECPSAGWFRLLAGVGAGRPGSGTAAPAIQGLPIRVGLPGAPKGSDAEPRLGQIPTGSVKYDFTRWYDSLMRAILPPVVVLYSYAGTVYANPHAVTSVGGTTYTYDNNGNVTAIGSLDYPRFPR
jgi:hypothetical protein